jgi:hypothetical protein
MLKAIAQLPTGLGLVFPSVTVATKVDRLVVPLALGETTLGLDCNVSFWAAEQGAVNETTRASLRVDSRAVSKAWMLATPAAVAVSDAVATPPEGVIVTTLLPELFHVPRDDTNVTLVVGDGAETVTASGVLSVPEIAVALAAGDVIWNVLAEAPVMVKAVVRVSPTPATVTVTAPAVAGVTVVENVPVVSVVPLDAPNVTVPVPVCDSVMVWPESTAPPEFFATTLSVAVDAPIVSDEFVVVSVSVEPEMRIGSCAVLPLAVATIVAVRVAALEPDENVTVALPVVSLVALDALSKPLSTENAIGTPDTAALDASVTVAVIVAVPVLSELTVEVDVETLIAAAVGVTVTGVVVLVDDELEPPPPQALNRANSANASQDVKARAKNLFNVFSCSGGLAIASILEASFAKYRGQSAR